MPKAQHRSSSSAASPAPAAGPSAGDAAGAEWRLSLEVTPKALVKLAAAELPPAGAEIFVPFLPGQAWGDTIAACRRLAGDGRRAVPHLTARTLADHDQLGERLAESVDAGAEAILLIAGDGKVPEGGFANTLEILRSGIVETRGPKHLYMAGHPTGHPHASEAELAAALEEKTAFARDTGIAITIVTQLVFEADPVMHWLSVLRDGPCDLPVRIGLAGPARLRNLMSFALQLGVGAAAEAALAQPQRAVRLLGGWTGDDLVSDLLEGHAAGRCPGLEGFHVYAFGGVAASCDWMAAMHQGLLYSQTPNENA